MNPTPEQLSKLPKWAQGHIYRLEQRIERQAGMLEEERPESSNVVVGDKYSSDPEHAYYLREYERVTFFLEGPKERACLRRWIEVRLRNGVVEVYGSGSLSIRPHATNYLELDVPEN